MLKVKCPNCGKMTFAHKHLVLTKENIGYKYEFDCEACNVRVTIHREKV